MVHRANNILRIVHKTLDQRAGETFKDMSIRKKLVKFGTGYRFNDHSLAAFHQYAPQSIPAPASADLVCGLMVIWFFPTTPN